MATVNLKHVILKDKWPGYPNFNLSKPANGFDSTVSGSGNNVDTALYPPGTKIAVQYTAADQTNWPGQSIFAYLKFYEGTDSAFDVGDPSTGYCACFYADLTTTGDGSIAGPYIITNDLTNSDGTQGGAIAFPCTDLSAGEYGWCWVGGVCPVADVTRLAGEIKTQGGVAEGCQLFIEDDGTNAAAVNIADATLITDSTSYNDLTQGFDIVIGKSLQVDA